MQTANHVSPPGNAGALPSTGKFAGTHGRSSGRNWRSTAFILGTGAIVILLIGMLNYYLGPRVSGSLFYLFPVLFVTHFAGRLAGILAAGMATAVWLAADLTDSAAYSHAVIPYWNAAMRLCVFLVVVWLVSTVRRMTTTLEERVEDRTSRLQAEVRERMNLERRILEISEREQARIGQDLHDGLCQHLVGTTFSANLLREQLAARSLPEAGDAAKIAALLDESITQARNLARGLYPVRLEEQGLATALQELVDGVSSRFNVRCELSCSGMERELKDETAIHLYRIAQEAVTNAVKHAACRRIEVELRLESGRFELRVADDGTGLSERISGDGGMGLHIMEYRSRMIGGQFTIGHRSGGGTLVICKSAEEETNIPETS
ncbi:MAG TPA: sensor histidine kinase [Verrucomicrobiota bacterium]|nr:sensor histidine kinase [Verrucomicrobiota bacterium]